MSGIVKIHGKDYKTVALRVSEFRSQYTIDEGWGIETQCAEVDDATVIMRARITDPEGRTVATGYAEETRSERGINSTSALENAETSAIGRALSAAGFGGDAYASADEVAQAISKQSTPRTREATEQQKQYAWSLIQKLPKAEQAQYIAKAKAADKMQLSKLIEELNARDS